MKIAYRVSCHETIIIDIDLRIDGGLALVLRQKSPWCPQSRWLLKHPELLPRSRYARSSSKLQSINNSWCSFLARNNSWYAASVSNNSRFQLFDHHLNRTYRTKPWPWQMRSYWKALFAVSVYAFARLIEETAFRG